MTPRRAILAAAIGAALATRRGARAAEPDWPSNFVSTWAWENKTAATTILSRSDISVAGIPYSLAMRMQVVISAGPAIMGVPRGTMPMVPASSSCAWRAPITSRIARIKRITPPATMKSKTVIPRKRKIVFPKTVKTAVSRNAVTIDSLTMRRCSSRAT